MAEAWLRRFGGEWFEVESAGTEPRDCVDPLAVAVMAECGVDISGCRPKDVWHFVREPWDFVITTCDRAAEDCPAFPVAHECIHWSFKDPAASEGTYEQRLQVYRRVRDEVMTRVRLFVNVQTRARV
jgi:arsenate reductase (thioredoxin)